MRRTAVFGTLAAALLLALVAWAAATGPDRVIDDPGATLDELGVAEPTVEPSEPGTAAEADDQPVTDEQPRPTPWWVRVVSLLLQLALSIVLVLAVLWLVRRGLRGVLARRARAGAEPPAPDFEVLPAQAAARELTRDAAAQRAALEAGEPRNAIVACWHRFEQQVGRAGLRRAPWQTTGEFVLDVLDEVGADRGAVARLADLYREARFSDHPVGEDERRRALEALDAVHAGLSSGVAR